jgi:hypothetical protein
VGKPNSVYKPKRFLGVHSEIIFFAVVVRTSKSRSIWYETLKLKSVKSTMRTGVVSFLLGGIFCVNLILSDAAEIVDVRSIFFEVVCSTIFLYQVRSGYFRADVGLVYILGFVEILALDAQ